MTERETPDVGSRVRAYRQGRGLSLRALAELCELSPNTISLIERGVTSPSVSTLQRLATALAVPITSFFAEEPERVRVMLTRADDRIRSGSASVVLESLGYGLEEQAYAPFFVTLRPQASSGRQVMTHPGQELVYCLRGVLEYEIAGDQHRLWPGDALLFHAEIPHRWSNPTDEPAEFLLVMQGVAERDTSVNQHLHP